MAKHNTGLNEVLGAKILKESPLMGAAAKLRRLSQYLGLPVLFAFLVGPPGVSPKESLMIYFLISMPIALSAFALRFWSYGYVREKQFIVNGPYRYVRNPAELAAVLAYVAGAILLRLPFWYTLIIVVISILYMSFVAIAYERTLLVEMGSAYLRYKQRVRRWIPSSLPATNSKKQDFLISRALFSDMKALVWFLGFLLVFTWRFRFGPLTIF